MRKKLLTLLIAVVMLLGFVFAKNTESESINKKQVILIKGETTTLEMKGTKEQVSWSSDNKSVATVTAKGKVTAKEKGSAKITAKVGKNKYSCRVIVETPALNKTSVTIYTGSSTNLVLNGSSRKPTWSSADTKIATVNSKGNVTAKSAGTTTIYASVGDKKYACEVTVLETVSETVTEDNIPAYSGEAYVELNNNVPNFSSSDKKRKDAFEIYSDLDIHGRCGVAYANICKELMPTKEREDISQIHPSGWQSNMGWERCHLIGFQLAGENANEKNLITGTHYFNVTGMLPFENKVRDYAENGHVLYRVTPVYTGKNFVANGVQMEGWSVEDGGKSICFNVFVYNVQPGKTIDYKYGYVTDNEDDNHTDSSEGYTYVLNTNTKKFHYSSCSSVSDIDPDHKQKFTGKREELIEQGYVPCKRCNP